MTFSVSVLSSGQNQELVSYSWIFPNVVTNGHWWYSNIPVYIEHDLRARLQAVPKTKQIGYYSDMYKLEFGLPKFNMYRRILAQVLADDFVRPGVLTETGALKLARCCCATTYSGSSRCKIVWLGQTTAPAPSLPLTSWPGLRTRMIKRLQR